MSFHSPKKIPLHTESKSGGQLDESTHSVEGDLDLLEEGSVASSHAASEVTKASTMSRISVVDNSDVKSQGAKSEGQKSHRSVNSKPHKHSSKDGDGNILVRPFAENNSPVRSYPKRRDMVPIHTMIGEKQTTLRVFQFNVLADGLAGLDKRHGDFCRASQNSLSWESRKKQLLTECTQYKPDIITLHECDHYYDFFLPELQKYGYDGFFASKPMSQCLEVSVRPDGSAMFINRHTVRMVSSQQFAFATSDTDDGSDDYYSENKIMVDGKLIPRCRQRKQQNQVCMINVLEHLQPADSPPIIVATTHLKAGKTSSCELVRRAQILQLLSCVNQIYQALREGGKTPAILVTGDLNTQAVNQGLAPLCYDAIKQNKLGLRSLLNDDVIPENLTGGEVYTTWKARREPSVRSAGGGGISDVKSVFEKEKGEIVGTETDATPRKSKNKSLKGGVDGDNVSISEKEVSVSESGGGRHKEHISKHAVDYIFYSPLRVDHPGFRALSVIDMYDEEDVGRRLLPSSRYPSDHIAIVADLELLW